TTSSVNGSCVSLIKRHYFYSGVAVPEKYIQITSPNDGTVADVLEKVGDVVRINTAVLTFDKSKLRLFIGKQKNNEKVAEANVSIAKSQLEAAVDKHNRLIRIPGLFSKMDVYDARQAIIADEARLSATQAQLEQAKEEFEYFRLKLDHATLHAGVNGVIADRFVNPGSHVVSNQLLFTVIDIHKMLIRFAVPPQDIFRFSVGSEIYIESGDHSRKLTGKVIRISPKLDESSQLVFLEASVNRNNGGDTFLYPGLELEVYGPCR
ncbi:MAG: efflux RND transporter periplasmic adaptor subunit, partial [Candidatus Saccharimonadales bacterium]